MTAQMRHAQTLSRVGIIAGTKAVIYVPPPATLPEAEWLLTHVDSGGAIAETPGDSNIRPYMSLYAAVGLVRAYEVSTNAAYLNAAWGFAAWYRDHMRVSSPAFSDNFARANGDLGAPWYYNGVDAHLSIVSNKVKSPGGAASVCYNVSSDDFTIEWDWYMGSAGGNCLMIFRAPPSLDRSTNLESYYQFSCNTAVFDGVTQYSVIGSTTPYGQTTGPGVLGLANGSTHTFKVVCSGGYVDCYLDGTAFAHWTAALIGSQRTIEFWMDADQTLDNVVITPSGGGSSTGYVGDYTVTYSGGVPTYTDSGAEDSTDAYAGMYLTLLWSLHKADPAHSLTAFAASVNLAVHAISTTQQIDGLTYALPTYDVKYLEDNVEALYGARCAQSLTWVLGGNATSADYVAAKHVADELARGVGVLWNWETHVWDYAIHASGAFARNDWTDENAQRQQIWATGWGEVVTPLDGENVLKAYVAALPNWDNTVGQWETMAMWAYRRAGNLSAATTSAARIEANALSVSRAYPWTCQTSGLMLIGQYGFTEGMDGTGADGLPIPDVTFPAGTNLLANSAFPDSNSDGLPDGISNYGGPTNHTLPLLSTENAYKMTVPAPNGYDMHWDATYDLSSEGGAWYCFSIYKKMTSVADDATSQMVLKWEVHDSSDAFITYGYNFYKHVDTDFQRVWISFLVPATGTPWAKMHLSVSIENGGEVILAAPKFENAGASPTPYASGVPVLA